MSNIIIEDEDIKVLLPEKASVAGEIVIVPNKKFVIMEEIPDELLKKMFQVGNKLAAVLFETLGCEGTNLLIQNGLPAGQVTDLVSLRIIPRFSNDELKLDWEPRKGADLDGVIDLLSGKEEEVAEKKIVENKKEEIKKEEDEIDDYLVSSFKRIP